MKVILMQNVPSLGKKFDEIEVKPGYANHYLIPHGVAVVANNAGKKFVEDVKAESAANLEQQTKDATLLKGELEANVLTFTLKADPNGDSIGHVTNKVLLSEINKDGKKINKFMFAKNYQLGFGEHEIKLDIFGDVVATVKVVVKNA